MVDALLDRREGPQERLPDDLSCGTPLRVALRAPRPLPPYNRMTGNGIAPAKGGQKAQTRLSRHLLEELNPLL